MVRYSDKKALVELKELESIIIVGAESLLKIGL